MSLNVRLLEQSFTVVKPHGDDLAAAFYRHLFAEHPEMRPLFQDVNESQRRERMLSLFRQFVQNLRRPDVLVPLLEATGAKNAALGIRQDHYEALGVALVKGLGEVSGDAWTGQMAVAWSEALGEIVHHLLNGAAQPTG